MRHTSWRHRATERQSRRGGESGGSCRFRSARKRIVRHEHLWYRALDRACAAAQRETRARVHKLRCRQKEWPYTGGRLDRLDRKSTRLNSSHGYISYAVFCLKKKKEKKTRKISV